MSAVTALLVALVLAQPGCAEIAAAQSRADAFDLRGAVERLERAASAACENARSEQVYLRGWIAAREAYRVGGSPESLVDARAAVAALDAAGDGIASYVLQAAAEAAQSERDGLALFIEQAVQLESVRLDAQLPLTHLITAHQAAGDLWLQVHRYEDARLAYQRAALRIGATRRVTLGLARAAVRLQDPGEACRQYRSLVAGWTDLTEAPPEIAEARQFLGTPACAPTGR